MSDFGHAQDTISVVMGGYRLSKALRVQIAYEVVQEYYLRAVHECREELL